MKLHRVEAHAIAIKGAQLRPLPIGLVGLLEGFVGPGQRPDPRQMVRRPVGALQRGPVTQGAVVGPKVLIAQMGRHVEDLMGRQDGNRASGFHGAASGWQDGPRRIAGPLRLVVW